MKKVVVQGALVLAAGMLSSGMAMAQERQPLEKWAHQKPAQAALQVPAGLAGVTFMRQASSGLNGPAINVFVGGEYLTSLEANGAKSLAICPHQQRLTVAYTNPASRYVEKQTQGQRFDLPVAQMSYFQVVAGADGKPALRQLDAHNAQQLMQGMQEQTHTLPRVDRIGNCAPAPAVAPVIKAFTLQAGALFAHNQWSVAHILPKGRDDITAMGREINQLGAAVGSVEVVGHTDPDGSHAYNRQLSQQRAQTVAQLLANAGVAASKVSVMGKGEDQLLVTDCQARHPGERAARQACNQPNRRVEVLVRGQAAAQ